MVEGFRALNWWNEMGGGGLERVEEEERNEE